MPGGSGTTFGYDSYGRNTTQTSWGVTLRTAAYDILNRVTQVTDAASNATYLRYDSLYLRSIKDASNQVDSVSRNALGWVVTHTDRAGRRDSIFYDHDGQPRRTVNRRGQEALFTYDDQHRRLTRTGTAIAADTLTYSSNGLLLVTSNAAASDTVYLNATRRTPDSIRTRFTVPGSGSQVFTRRFRYNSRGLLDSMTAGSGSVTILSRGFSWDTTYTFLNTGMRIGSLGWTTFGYNLDFNRVGTWLPNGDSILQGYVTAHDLSALISPILDDSMHYDSLGRLDRMVEGGKQRLFTYNSVGRLSSIRYETNLSGCGFDLDRGFWCGGSQHDSTIYHSYDAVDNRSGGTYGAGHRLNAFGGCSYITDSLVGNVTRRTCGSDTTRFGWSADSRMIADTVAGIARAFHYNAQGRLVRIDSAGTAARYFLWNGEDLLAELGSGATTMRAEFSYYGTDNLHALVYQDTAYYAATDAIGNVRGLMLNSWPLNAYSYDEWGNGGTSQGSPFNGADLARWKGALYLAPEAGLYYMRNRWYEPRSGRFLSEDPIGFDGGINPYAYGSNNPVTMSDPAGLGPCPPGWSWSPTINRCVPLVQGFGGATERSGPSVSSILSLLEDEARRRAMAGDGCRERSTMGHIDCYATATEPAPSSGLRPSPLKGLVCSGLRHLGPLGGLVGVAADAVFIQGMTLAAGIWVNRDGIHLYGRAGYHVGLDISGGVEFGPTVGDISGLGGEIAGGSAISGSVAASPSGASVTGSISPISLPLSGRVGVTYTGTRPLVNCQ